MKDADDVKKDGLGLRSVEIYDSLTGEWSEGPTMIKKRSFADLLVVCGKLYAVGGDLDEDENTAIRTIECLNTERYPNPIQP